MAAVVESATAAAPADLPDIDVLEGEEGRAYFDRRARARLGISGEEFLRRWDAGEYRPVPDTPDDRKIARLVMLMPFAGRSLS